jgi:hypothetical protein
MELDMNDEFAPGMFHVQQTVYDFLCFMQAGVNCCRKVYRSGK